MCYSGFYEGDKLLPIDTEKEELFIKETLKTITGTILAKYSQNKE